MADTDDTDDIADREWRYIGQRLTTHGIGTAWIDHTGTERVYRSSRGDRSRLAIGAIYNVRSSSDGTRAATRGAEFVRIDDRAAGDVPAWVAADRAAVATMAQDEAIKAAKRIEAGGIDRMTIAEARRFINGGGWYQTAARAAVILRALGIA